MFLIQLTDKAVLIVYPFLISFLIFKLISIFTGLKVSSDEENAGLDISLHGERAYN
ncbi:MAG: hypothetical protein ACQEQS_05120 [Thermodesulfobacteriota bacterium]